VQIIRANRGKTTQERPHAFCPPTRLALQTGQLDDHRPDITPDHALWGFACQRFVARGRINSVMHDDEMSALSHLWPARTGRPAHLEALAVAVALAIPFAGRDRILEALATPAVLNASLRRELSRAPSPASPWSPQRPRFPHIYDPDAEPRLPTIALLDGPRSARVGKFLAAIKSKDPRLADAIVLGIPVDQLELLDDPAITGHRRRPAREWQLRADGKRRAQRHEGALYGWCSDNLPPGCLQTARGTVQQDVRVLLELLSVS
jgi:hypothetical protein